MKTPSIENLALKINHTSFEYSAIQPRAKGDILSIAFHSFNKYSLYRSKPEIFDNQNVNAEIREGEVSIIE